jgi:hypothetical protein
MHENLLSRLYLPKSAQPVLGTKALVFRSVANRPEVVHKGPVLLILFHRQGQRRFHRE